MATIDATAIAIWATTRLSQRVDPITRFKPGHRGVGLAFFWGDVRHVRCVFKVCRLAKLLSQTKHVCFEDLFNEGITAKIQAGKMKHRGNG